MKIILRLSLLLNSKYSFDNRVNAEVHLKQLRFVIHFILYIIIVKSINEIMIIINYLINIVYKCHI